MWGVLMSAMDFIRGGRERGVKKRKLDVPWDVSGSVLVLSGSAVSGVVEWDRSRYLKTGGHLDFHAFVSGTMYVLPEIKRESYVAPKMYSMMPLQVLSDDDDE